MFSEVVLLHGTAEPQPPVMEKMSQAGDGSLRPPNQVREVVFVIIYKLI